MKKRKIYIVLTDTGTLMTKMIKSYTKSPYNHVSIAFDKELTEMYSFGRKNPYNPLFGGFVHERIDNHLFKRADCEIYSLTVTDNEYKKLLDSISQLKMNQSNYKYNLLGLFGVIANREINRKNAYFCSQFVATLLRNSGIRLSNKAPGLTTPEDLRKAAALQLEYKGPVLQYPHRKKLGRTRESYAVSFQSGEFNL